MTLRSKTAVLLLLAAIPIPLLAGCKKEVADLTVTRTAAGIVFDSPDERDDCLRSLEVRPLDASGKLSGDESAWMVEDPLPPAGGTNCTLRFPLTAGKVPPGARQTIAPALVAGQRYSAYVNGTMKDFEGGFTY